jgi:hypothetical protein
VWKSKESAMKHWIVVFTGRSYELKQSLIREPGTIWSGLASDPQAALEAAAEKLGEPCRL